MLLFHRSAVNLHAEHWAIKDILAPTRRRGVKRKPWDKYPGGYNAAVEAESRKAVDRRLARIEGQVRGLRRMVERDEYCADILTQMAAIRSALDQVGAELAVSHVRTCILGHGQDSEHEKAKCMTQDELLDELRVTLSRLVR